MVPSFQMCRRHAGRVHPERNNSTIAGNQRGMDTKIVGFGHDDDIV